MENRFEIMWETASFRLDLLYFIILFESEYQSKGCKLWERDNTWCCACICLHLTSAVLLLCSTSTNIIGGRRREQETGRWDETLDTGVDCWDLLWRSADTMWHNYSATPATCWYYTIYIQLIWLYTSYQLRGSWLRHWSQ